MSMISPVQFNDPWCRHGKECRASFLDSLCRFVCMWWNCIITIVLCACGLSLRRKLCVQNNDDGNEDVDDVFDRYEELRKLDVPRRTRDVLQQRLHYNYDCELTISWYLCPPHQRLQQRRTVEYQLRPTPEGQNNILCTHCK